MKMTLRFLGIIAILTIASVLFGGSKAHAATLDVVAGTDAIDANGQCQLSEAIQNINDQAQTNADCSAGDGNNDTINLPAGTITLSADLPALTQSIIVQGQGMGNSIVNGDNGQFKGIGAESAALISINNVTITAFQEYAVQVSNNGLVLSNVEVDGQDAVSSGEFKGIIMRNDDGNQYSLGSDNVYIHDMEQHSGNSYLHAFVIAVSNGGQTDATITNTTLARIHATGSTGLNGFAMHIGTFGGGAGDGELNVNISNTTIDDVTSEALTAPFNAAAFANGGNATISVIVNNITITGTRGVDGSGITAGLKSAAFYAAGLSIGPEDVSIVNMTVSNSLMGDNNSDGVSSNCALGDLNTNFGGAGSVTTNINSGGHNLSDDASCVSFTQPGDQQNLSNILSTLGTLQNNGGLVPTRALLQGSPAIGAGSSVLGVSTDARGIARPTTPDVGAYQTVLGTNTNNSDGSNPGGSITGVGVPNTGLGRTTRDASPSALVLVAITLFALLAAIASRSIHKRKTNA